MFEPDTKQQHPKLVDTSLLCPASVLQQRPVRHWPTDKGCPSKQLVKPQPVPKNGSTLREPLTTTNQSNLFSPCQMDLKPRGNVHQVAQENIQAAMPSIQAVDIANNITLSMPALASTLALKIDGFQTFYSDSLKNLHTRSQNRLALPNNEKYPTLERR